MRLFLSVTAREVQRAARATKLLAHAAYRIGPSSSLLRQDLLLDTRGGLLSLSDEDAPAIPAPESLAAAVSRECARRGYEGAVLDFDRPPAPDRQRFAQALVRQLSPLRRTVYLPEPYALPGGVTLINTAVSGGSFQERLLEAQGRYDRIALDVQRLLMDFTLPARTGCGTDLTLAQFQQIVERESPAVFFSQELCARYFTYQSGGETHFLLYDDAETLLRKCRTAAAMGVDTAFFLYPEVSDLLERLFPVKGGK